jgi:hypothetical protein
MPNPGVSGAVEQWLKNKGKRFTRALGVALLLVFIAIDVAVNFLLREAPVLVTAGHKDSESDAWILEFDSEDYTVGWSWSDLTHHLTDFKGDTVDMLLMTTVRVVLLMVLLQLGIRLGTPKLDNIIPDDNVCAPVAPLLINAGEESLHELTSEAKKTHLESYRRQKLADVRKNVVVGVLFVLSTLAQVFTGVKVIGFVGHWDDGDSHAATIRTMQATLFFACVFLINCEAFVANRLINTLTVEEGFLVPEFHQHRLFCTRLRLCMCLSNPALAALCLFAAHFAAH